MSLAVRLAKSTFTVINIPSLVVLNYHFAPLFNLHKKYEQPTSIANTNSEGACTIMI